MKYRFSIEILFPHSEISQEEAEKLLYAMMWAGQRAFGHSKETMGFAIEKLRARSVDLDKPVGEQE